MQTILCYGDSNTWGADPAGTGRFPPDVRWTGVLQGALGDRYRVIEEGLNGRTTLWDDPIEPGRNGKTYLRPCLESHRPLDLVLVMLGTNDLKARFALSPSDIAQAAAAVARLALRTARTADDRPSRVLLVAPPAVTGPTDLDQMFAGAAEKSRLFPRYYRLFAERYGLPFFDAATVVTASPLDGVHFEADQHRNLGEALATEARRLLG